MELIEVAKLYKHIKKHFPFFDATTDKVREDHERYLKSFPAEVAWSNIDHHIQVEIVTPGIAHIRGRLGDQIDSQRSKQAAADHLNRLESWRQLDQPPPPNYWQNIRKMIKGAGNADD
ncbi:hypothetical protein [Paenibacillus daejeonensis]|uniref:hypothetical protein n=1 Tax=Paenibacillus daejeonensis TaxID=135193 RepID=UPI000372FA07|nr:hypothetical protein [Paenibacillus daejeonensis]